MPASHHHSHPCQHDQYNDEGNRFTLVVVGVAPSPFHWFCPIAEQALNQEEARGRNLFNDDEEDIERYIDDDDDDFVDNVRFQDEQVEPSSISAKLSFLHARTSQEWGWQIPQEENTQELQVALVDQEHAVIYQVQEEEEEEEVQL